MTIGHCKHGEFELEKGCKECIAERHDFRAPEPISEEARDILTAGRDVMIANATAPAKRPPAEQRALVKVDPLADLEVGALVIEAEKILSYAKTRQVTTTEQAKNANDDLSIISGIKKRMDTCRKQYLDPINAIKDQLINTFKDIMSPILEADKITRDKMLSYDQEQRRIRAEQERINTLRLEAAQKEMELNGELSESVNLVDVIEPAKRVSTDMGTSSVRDNWKYRVVDFALLSDEYKIEDSSMLNAVAKKHHDTKKVPGIEFYNEPIIAVRSK